jgi:DNA invertase Pin-like site-specific DNA recombinase
VKPSKTVRCAIYTRVSTDQGLEQDFNSLDAQYDASQAYMASNSIATTRTLSSAGSRRSLASGQCMPSPSSVLNS